MLGIDLAAQPTKTCACVLESEGTRLTARLHAGCDDEELTALVDGCRKVAIDAPFGWPEAFVGAVAGHHDGKRWPKPGEDGLTALTESLCFRATDRAVTQVRRPLSVAADKLGVTAMRCARLLDAWGKQGKAIDRTGSGRFVEVYPAAALVRWGLDPQGYKGAKGKRKLSTLLAKLRRQLPVLDLKTGDRELVASSDDAFDALVAALVGRAALLDLTDGPPKSLHDDAFREGWIHIPVRGSLPVLGATRRELTPKPAGALAEQLGKSSTAVNSAGYAAKFDDVLISTVSAGARRTISEQLSGKKGSELNPRQGGRPKFQAAHSSAALAANNFAPFLDGSEPVPFSRKLYSGPAELERECPTGLPGTPPTLDFVVEAKQILAVESKCIEPFSDHPANFKRAYADVADRMHPSWRSEYERLLDNPHRYRHLDAAQLIKHYLGLKSEFPDRSIVLTYLYWEPLNASELAPCRIHQAEIEAFAGGLGDPQVQFKPISYPELWRRWERRPGLAKHVKALRRRYEVNVSTAS